MKKKVAFYFMILLLISGCKKNNKDNINSFSYYSFNAGSQDEFNGSVDVHIQGATLTMDRFGNKKNAYYFDGKHSSIWIALKNFPRYKDIKSVSWWYSAENDIREKKGFAAENMIVLVDTHTKTGIQFGFRAPGYKTLGLDVWHWGGGNILDVPLPSGKKWHHCVYTFDGKINRFYLDGKESASSDVNAQDGTPTQIMFGNYPTGNQYFKGKLDEILIFDKVLSLPDIESLYNGDVKL